MKNLRTQKLFTVAYPLTALILGFVLGYATIFFKPYVAGIAELTNTGVNLEIALNAIIHISLITCSISFIITVIKDTVLDTSINFTLFGLAYLGSLAYFTMAIYEVVTKISQII
ncbi:MAG: hypothetical protein MRY57_00800 [Candidatus Pacebacteria bacterium]|nr:hypothetical protein [Candidatus Paceibacterota bacterium]